MMMDFACDDISKVESWMSQTLEDLCAKKDFNVKAVNFATYGASLMYLDAQGRRLTPVYNYLKPMPERSNERILREIRGQLKNFPARLPHPLLEC